MSTDAVRMSQWPSDQRYVIPVAPGPDVVTVTIDGKEVQAPRGELLIKVAQEHGTYIPRFCWHERMKPVGMCRMCLVEVEGMRGMQISCATPVTDGMVVNTQSPTVKAVQDGVLEFLLINHPLDCPVCDRGGECPLQDQTLAFGPGESRFVEEKRHFEKPVPISDLVLLDRERCIQCGRCTRFAAEIAGDPLIDFGERGANTQVITYPDEPFSSYFSGNTVQICPVGALTASSYRFRARPWDLQTVETSCTTCAVGCRGALQSTSNRIVRLLGVDSEPVNQGWLCDKGRYGYEWVHSEDRVRAPMVRTHGELVEVSWPEALDAAAAGLQAALDADGPRSIAVLGGARGTNEDAYVWARLAKSVLGTDNVDAQLGDGLPAEVVLGLPGATIADIDNARGVVLVAPDLREELPVLHLRLRRAAVELGVPVVELAPRATGLTRDVTAVLRHAPGEAGAMAEQFARALAEGVTASASGSIEKAVSAFDGRDGDIVVVIGRQSLAESPASVVQAAAALAALGNVKFLVAVRRGNVRGALELGLTPGFLPGRVTLEAARDHYTSEWGAVPAQPGLDAAGIFEAAAAGSIGALVLLGAEPEEDFPDRIRMRAGLDAVPFVVAVGAFTDDAAARADVFLPTSVWGEKGGSTTNLEGRVQRLARLITPEGLTMDDWRIAQELATRFDAVFGYETVEDVQDEIARVAPAFAGVDAELVRRARDGAVLPIAEFPDEIVFQEVLGLTTGRSWEPIKPGVAADESHLSSLGTGAIAAGGSGSDPIKPGLASGEGPEEDEASAEEAVEVATEALAARPALHVWDRVATTPVPTPPDAYSLRLVAARMLYDAGRMVSSSPSLTELASGASLIVHPSDLSRIGVSGEGDDVLVTTPRGTIRLPVLADSATAPGTAFMAFAQGGAVGPNDIVDIAAAVTELRVETTVNAVVPSMFGPLVAITDPLFDRGVNTTVVLIIIGKTIAVFVLLLLSVLMYIWFLRKVIAKMQNRIGPDRAGPFGLLQSLADGIKLFFKEQSEPNTADRRIFRLAPYLALLPAFLAFSIVPIGGVVTIAGHETFLQLADLPFGILWLIAMSGLGLYGVLLAGWASGSKYPLLGSVHASAQLLSYEAAFGLAIVGVLVQSNTLSTRGIVIKQGWDGIQSIFNGDWYWLPAIVALVIFVISAVAETNHPPFDLVEAEQELTGGFFTEYTGIKFAIFYLAEFMNVITMCAIAVTLFFGGPNGPGLGFLPANGWFNAWIMPVFWFFLKVIVLLFGTVWLRASLPRLRYDQLMGLGWKFLIEIAFLWVMISGVVIVAKEQGWSMWIVLPAAITGTLAIGTTLYLSVPKKTELVEEIR